jgi:hypothetical protein
MMRDGSDDKWGCYEVLSEVVSRSIGISGRLGAESAHKAVQTIGSGFEDDIINVNVEA